MAEGIAALFRPAGEEDREDVMFGALLFAKALTAIRRIGGDFG